MSKDARELHGDDTAADGDEAPRDFGQTKDLGAVDRVLNSRDRRAIGFRASRNDHLAGRDPAGISLQRVRIEEPNGLAKLCHVSLFQRLAFLREIAFDEAIFASDGACPVDALGLDLNAKLTHLVCQAEQLCGPDQGLLRDAPAVESSPA